MALPEVGFSPEAAWRRRRRLVCVRRCVSAGSGCVGQQQASSSDGGACPVRFLRRCLVGLAPTAHHPRRHTTTTHAPHNPTPPQPPADRLSWILSRCCGLWSGQLCPPNGVTGAPGRVLERTTIEGDCPVRCATCAPVHRRGGVACPHPGVEWLGTAVRRATCIRRKEAYRPGTDSAQVE